MREHGGTTVEINAAGEMMIESDRSNDENEAAATNDLDEVAEQSEDEAASDEEDEATSDEEESADAPEDQATSDEDEKATDGNVEEEASETSEDGEGESDEEMNDGLRTAEIGPAGEIVQDHGIEESTKATTAEMTMRTHGGTTAEIDAAGEML